VHGLGFRVLSTANDKRIEDSPRESVIEQRFSRNEFKCVRVRFQVGLDYLSDYISRSVCVQHLRATGLITGEVSP
jgi:hypothetical protein